MEATMCMTCVLIIPENSFYLQLLTHFLTETETWVVQEDVPWATYHDNVYPPLFDKKWPSYQFFSNADVIIDIMCTSTYHA